MSSVYVQQADNVHRFVTEDKRRNDSSLVYSIMVGSLVFHERCIRLTCLNIFPRKLSNLYNLNKLMIKIL